MGCNSLRGSIWWITPMLRLYDVHLNLIKASTLGDRSFALLVRHFRTAYTAIYGEGNHLTIFFINRLLDGFFDTF